MVWRAVLFVVCLLSIASLRAERYTNPTASGSGKKSDDKFLIAGCGWNKVAILDKATEQLEWVHPIGKGEDCNDVELTRRNEVLYAYTKGARLVPMKHEVVWDYKVKSGEELFTATELPAENYLLGICGHPARIVELDKTGQVVYEWTFETGISQVHNQFRQLIKTKKDTYVIPLFGKGEVIELNRSGEVLRRVKTGGNPFSVKLLRREQWLVGCGDAHKWVEIDPRREKITRTLDNLSGIKLLFVAEVHRYKNGCTLLANWNGHSKDKTQPKIIELNKHNQVVWRLKHDYGISNVSAVYPFKSK